MKLKWIETYDGVLINTKHISSLVISTSETNTKGICESVIAASLLNGKYYYLKKYNHKINYIDKNGVIYDGKTAAEIDFDYIKENIANNLLELITFNKDMYLQELTI